MLFKKIFHILFAVTVFVFFFQLWKPYPEKLLVVTHMVSVPDSSIKFIADTSYTDKDGVRKTEQQIWDRIFTLIDDSEKYIFLDMFLFNSFQGQTVEEHRKLSEELTDRLVKKMESNPHHVIVFLTDPINTVYGGVISPELERLKKAGVLVIMTDLSKLPDSNRLWGAIWRPFFSWSGNSQSEGWLPHPFQKDGAKVSLRSWAGLFNFKANHRKLLVVDVPDKKKGSGKDNDGGRVVTLVTSSNPHTASSAHGNVALEIEGYIWKDAMFGELAIAEISNASFPMISGATESVPRVDSAIRLQLLYDKNIRTKALEMISTVQKDDTIDLAMFYLSDRGIVRALVDASKRGAKIRIILDPNENAFGWKKNGVPNRPVAKELVSGSGGDIAIRWCNTTGEQCHAKLLLGKTATTTFMMLGSANFTRRNIGGFNLEADVVAESARSFTAWEDAEQYFEQMWLNKDEKIYTVDYSVYQDNTFWKTSLYRMMERTGLSSF